MRHRSFLFAALLMSPAVSATQDARTVAYMYDLCKQSERMEDGDEQSLSDQVKAMQCMAYMAGALGGYNFATARTCDLSHRNAAHLTRTFLQYVRSQPTSSRETSTQITVGMLMDNCFCHKDRELASAMCPVLPVD